MDQQNQLLAEAAPYVGVALILAVSRNIGNTDSGVHPAKISDLTAAISAEFKIELPDSLVETIILDSLKDRQYISKIESRFNSTWYRFHISDPEQVVSYHFDADEVWKNYRSAGKYWLAECLSNINSEFSGNSSKSESSATVPASDRYVDRSDNEPEIGELNEALAKASEEVRGNNEADEDAKLIALSELAIFEATLVQPRLAVDLIERFLSFCRRSLTKMLTASLAAKIIELLGGLLEKFAKSLVAA